MDQPRFGPTKVIAFFWCSQKHGTETRHRFCTVALKTLTYSRRYIMQIWRELCISLRQIWPKGPVSWKDARQQEMRMNILFYSSHGNLREKNQLADWKVCLLLDLFFFPVFSGGIFFFFSLLFVGIYFIWYRTVSSVFIKRAYFCLIQSQEMKSPYFFFYLAPPLYVFKEQLTEGRRRMAFWYPF